jgi:hypothetical protein
MPSFDLLLLDFYGTLCATRPAIPPGIGLEDTLTPILMPFRGGRRG